MSARNCFDEALRSPDWLVVREDFIRESSSIVPDTMSFDVIKDSSASSICEADQAGGVLLMSSAATTDNDGNLVQSINEFVLPTSGKRFAFSCEIKGADADQQDVFVGLAQRAATNPENTLTASNRIGFQINDEDASILLKSEASDLETSKDSESDLADATWVKLSFYYDGSGRVTYYINDSAVGSISSNIPATELAVALFQLSGNNSGTHTLRVRRLRVAVEL